MIYTEEQIIKAIEKYEFYSFYKNINGVNVIVENLDTDDLDDLGVVYASVTIDYTQDSKSCVYDNNKYILETLKQWIIEVDEE